MADPLAVERLSARVSLRKVKRADVSDRYLLGERGDPALPKVKNKRLVKRAVHSQVKARKRRR